MCPEMRLEDGCETQNLVCCALEMQLEGGCEAQDLVCPALEMRRSSARAGCITK